MMINVAASPTSGVIKLTILMYVLVLVMFIVVAFAVLTFLAGACKRCFINTMVYPVSLTMCLAIVVGSEIVGFGDNFQFCCAFVSCSVTFRDMVLSRSLPIILVFDSND